MIVDIFDVAPFAGAWIEIFTVISGFARIRSLPLRERGLKFHGCQADDARIHVAPFAGAWIEIPVPKM